jgi:hypothetical protein
MSARGGADLAAARVGAVNTGSLTSRRKAAPSTSRRQPRNGEGGAPAERLRQQPGRQRGAGNPHIAPDAVDADDAAEPVGAIHQQRGADRMIDRADQADQGQPAE